MPVTDELLVQLERFLPPEYESYRPILAGYAAAAARAREVLDDLVGEVSIGGADGLWLTLLAHGYGVSRATLETDASLRIRLRNVAGKVTRPVLLGIADQLLAAYTELPAEMVEHWGAGVYCDDETATCDASVLFDQHNAFTLLVPQLAEAVVGVAFCDQAFADVDFAGGGAVARHPAYAALLSEIDRARAAGVRWWLVVTDRVAGAPFGYGDLSYADTDHLWS